MTPYLSPKKQSISPSLSISKNDGFECLPISTPLKGLSEPDCDVNIDFIPPDVMIDWRKWVQGALDWEFSWERLRFMARRIMSRNSHYSQERMDFFLRQFFLPNANGIESVYEFVPQSNLDVYRQKIMDFVSEFAQEYLN